MGNPLPEFSRELKRHNCYFNSIYIADESNISFNVAPLALGQSRDCPLYDGLSDGEVTLKHRPELGFYYPSALKGSGVLSPERAGGRQGRQAALTLSRP